MAILTGINSKLRGSIGNVTYSRLNGQTVAKEKVEKKSTPVRTQAQMYRRVRWANLVNLYKTFEGTLHPSFEGKAPTVSDYNMFMQANVNRANVSLTKDIAAQGGCVVGPYQITRGQLPSITSEFGSNNIAETDIALGTLSIGSSTTLVAFSTAIIQNNTGWRDGDQLSAYIARQLTDSTGVPRVEIEAIEITLDTDASNTTLLSDVVDSTLLSVADGCLALSSSLTGAVAFVHSRKSKGKTIVSTQFFVTNNTTALGLYATAGARDNAILSYGGINQDDFLTPNIGDDTVLPDVNP